MQLSWFCGRNELSQGSKRAKGVAPTKGKAGSFPIENDLVGPYGLNIAVETIEEVRRKLVRG
jgi:hypothetical protein